MAVQNPCPLLGLPAELRLQIYEHALCPTGTLTLTSTPSHRYSISPTVTPALLATCRQIHHEAAPLLTSLNTLALTLDAHETYWPPIAESRLPQYVLEKAHHLCVIFDCTADFAAAGYEEVDFEAFEACVKLRSLRVEIVHTPMNAWGRAGRDAVERGVELFTEVLMRVPRGVEINCGVEQGSQEEMLLEDLLVARRRGRQAPHVTEAVSKDDLEAAIAQVPHDIRGVKSGGNCDVFAKYREQEQMGEARRFAVL